MRPKRTFHFMSKAMRSRTLAVLPSSFPSRRDPTYLGGRTVRRHLVHSGLPVGGIAVALMLGTTALLSLPVSVALLGAAFCGTALVYLADRVLGTSPEDALNCPDRVAWQQEMRGWIAAESIGLALGLLVCLPYLRAETLLAACGMGAVAGLHVGLPGHPTWRLKRWGCLKPLAISGAWALGAVALPILEAGAPWTWGGIALIGYRVAFIVPNVLLADWRDRRGDAVYGVAALGSDWHRTTVQRVGSICLGLAALGATGMAWLRPSLAPLLIVDALGLVALGVGLHRLRPRQVAWHMLALDLVVAWPGVTWLVSLGLGGT